MCLNAVTRLQEDCLPGYQSIKRHSGFSEYFNPDRDHPSYYWNIQIYTSLGYSQLVAMTNDTCLKLSISPQAYKVVSTDAHEISGWTIISRLLHSRATHLGGMNGDVKYYLSRLEFKNGENLKIFMALFSDLNKKLCSLEKFSLLLDFYSSTWRHFQRVIKKIFHCSQDYRSHHIPRKRRKSAVYTGGDINGIYRYIEMIGSPTTFITQFSALIISALHHPSTMVQHLSSQLFQLSARDRRVFVNAVEELDTNLMPASSVVQNSSHQVL